MSLAFIKLWISNELCLYVGSLGSFIFFFLCFLVQVSESFSFLSFYFSFFFKVVCFYLNFIFFYRLLSLQFNIGFSYKHFISKLLKLILLESLSFTCHQSCLTLCPRYRLHSDKFFLESWFSSLSSLCAKENQLFSTRTCYLLAVSRILSPCPPEKNKIRRLPLKSS